MKLTNQRESGLQMEARREESTASGVVDEKKRMMKNSELWNVLTLTKQMYLRKWRKRNGNPRFEGGKKWEDLVCFFLEDLVLLSI